MPKVKLQSINNNSDDSNASNSSACNIDDLSIVRAEHYIDNFPTTRYYGSKKRVLKWIFENVKDLQFKSVLDGFGGTASVSLLFKLMGKDVTYNDALVSNTIIARALLANEMPLYDDEFVNFIDSIEPVNGFISKTFENKFYLSAENSWLDGAIQEINKENNKKRSAYLYCLFQACLQKRPFNLFHRANLYIRLNKNVKKSFGNQTTWETPFPELIKRAYGELKKTVWRSPATIQVLESTDVNRLEPGYDLVYLDPPYINPKVSADDYQRRYHFLEGLCKYEQWGELIDNRYNNLQLRSNEHISSWHKKISFQEKLFGLVERHSKSIVVLSYVDDAYPSVSVIKNHFNSLFAECIIDYHNLSHALSKGSKREVLFIGMPK